MTQSPRVRILLFGAFQEAVGSAEIQLQLAPVTTVDGLWEELRERWPHLAALDPIRLAAVNLDFAAGDRVLEEDDEVAFFPPVSGG